MSDLLKAAKAVITRWETPLWKDVPATTEYIYRLRDAVEQAEKQEADFDTWFVKNYEGVFDLAIYDSIKAAWTASQQAERERIRDIIKAVGVQGEHDKWFDACDAIMERIDAAE